MRLTTRLLSSLVQKRPFYVTTPIFYVNAAPHLGHLYTAVVADAIQRFEKLTNPDCKVIFSTGTDEHGTKIQQAAAKANQSPPEYCSTISKEYRDLFKEFHVDYTDFVRTTEERHLKAVKHFWKELRDQDYIYKAKYSGWYSVNDEAFVPETHTREEVTNDGKVRVSIESGHRVEWTEESNYMFRLSAFKTHLKNWLKTDGVVKPVKFHKQLQEMVEDDVYLPDISVSRPASRVHWAIRVPDDEEQSIYVWLDALVNYLTVSGYPDDELVKSRGRPWPADVQVVGKDIMKFHGIYWPAFLMAARRHPPRRLLVHSHWTVNGNKMSKSVGNVVHPRGVPAAHALRYLLLREATVADDAKICHKHYTNYQFYKVVDAVIRALHMANLFFETLKPWELKKKPECQKELDVVLHVTLETIRICSIILQPIVPDISKKVLDKLQIPECSRNWTDCEVPSWNMEDAIHETKKIQGGKFVLFPRIYVDKSQKRTSAKTA
ncbi:methionine--tRNA ligase, mitochondrial isoform X2 [Colias croceus]|uniref:methionine--tRNA ligase, mitochondrial isoform X2 n=1 Tax=Colias crocea TaxID=72248 RepID=UPI001E27B136|nr:methionine--tRNA ligase, mitochondrial isoform X2 [Colias croceus]